MSKLSFPGLKASPSALKETMLPNISPELVADAAVQVFGGYNPSLFGVSIWVFLNIIGHSPMSLPGPPPLFTNNQYHQHWHYQNIQHHYNDCNNLNKQHYHYIPRPIHHDRWW